MTFQARYAVILVISLPRMLVVHVWLVVLMAGQAGETGIVVHVLVTLCTIVPFTPVLARIDGKELCIMNGKIGWLPVRLGGMAFQAVGGDVCCYVVRVGCSGIIVLMTGITVGGCTGETTSMALVAILDIVSRSKWKEIVPTNGNRWRHRRR